MWLLAKAGSGLVDGCDNHPAVELLRRPLHRRRWFKNKLVAVALKASPCVLNIAHSHDGNAGYFGETQATVNADSTGILFASSWGSALESDVSDYPVTLFAGTLAGRVGGAACPL